MTGDLSHQLEHVSPGVMFEVADLLSSLQVAGVIERSKEGVDEEV